jgi:hypothetical protein
MVTIIKKSAKKSEIDKILKTTKKQRPKKSLNASKYCGILKIDDDPVQTQKKLRNEWN